MCHRLLQSGLYCNLSTIMSHRSATGSARDLAPIRPNPGHLMSFEGVATLKGPSHIKRFIAGKWNGDYGYP